LLIYWYQITRWRNLHTFKRT